MAHRERSLARIIEHRAIWTISSVAFDDCRRANQLPYFVCSARSLQIGAQSPWFGELGSPGSIDAINNPVLAHEVQKVFLIREILVVQCDDCLHKTALRELKPEIQLLAIAPQVGCEVLAVHKFFQTHEYQHRNAVVIWLFYNELLLVEVDTLNSVLRVDLLPETPPQPCVGEVCELRGKH